VAIRVPQFRRSAPQPASIDASAPIDSGAVRAFLYDAEAEDRQIDLDAIRVHRLDDRQLLWIDVSDLDQLEPVAAGLALAPDTVARMTRPRNRAELLFHTDYFHVNVVVADRTSFGYQAASLDCAAGANWILTVHDRPVDFLERFHERIRGDSQLGRLDAPGLVATFLHEHVASFVLELEPFEAELDRLDLEVMTGSVDDDAVFRRLVDLRRRLSYLRRLFAAHREVYALLARPDFEMLSDTDSREGFASLAERSEHAVQALETTREMIVSSFEIYTTWTAHGTNKVMKLLTVASVALLPPTFLASLMGMNSLPSPLWTATAFALTLCVMLVLVGTVLVAARRRSWI
jgi:Mg2+ and Co2+ transporter CorA